MTKKALKLLDRMRQSKSGWKPRDLQSLYISYGFLISHGASHDIIKHSKYPQLRTTLPRHNEIAKIYVDIAIRLIDQLTTIQKAEEAREEQNDEPQTKS
jgi:hypothetical protein